MSRPYLALFIVSYFASVSVVEAGICNLVLFDVNANKSRLYQTRPDVSAARNAISKDIRLMYPDAVLLFLKSGFNNQNFPATAAQRRIHDSNVSELEKRQFFEILDTLRVLDPSAANTVIERYWREPSLPFFSMKIEAQNALATAKTELANIQERMNNHRAGRLRGAEIVMSLINPRIPGNSVGDLMKRAEAEFTAAAKEAKTEEGRRMFENAAARIKNLSGPVSSGATFRLMINQSLGFSVAEYHEGSWRQVATAENILGSPEARGARGRALVHLATHDVFLANRNAIASKISSAREMLKSQNLQNESDRLIVDQAIVILDQASQDIESGSDYSLRGLGPLITVEGEN